MNLKVLKNNIKMSKNWKKRAELDDSFESIYRDLNYFTDSDYYYTNFKRLREKKAVDYFTNEFNGLIDRVERCNCFPEQKKQLEEMLNNLESDMKEDVIEGYGRRNTSYNLPQGSEKSRFRQILDEEN